MVFSHPLFDHLLCALFLLWHIGMFSEQKAFVELKSFPFFPLRIWRSWVAWWQSSPCSSMWVQTFSSAECSLAATFTWTHFSIFMYAQLPLRTKTMWQRQAAINVSKKWCVFDHLCLCCCLVGLLREVVTQISSGLLLGPQRPLHHGRRRDWVIDGGKREDLVGGTVHRGRGGGTRDTSEQVENRRFTLSLYPQGWRERSKEAGRRRDNNEKESQRVKMQLGWENWYRRGGGVTVRRHVVVSEGKKTAWVE